MNIPTICEMELCTYMKFTFASLFLMRSHVYSNFLVTTRTFQYFSHSGVFGTYVETVFNQNEYPLVNRLITSKENVKNHS